MALLSTFHEWKQNKMSHFFNHVKVPELCFLIYSIVCASVRERQLSVFMCLKTYICDNCGQMPMEARERH